MAISRIKPSPKFDFGDIASSSNFKSSFGNNTSILINNIKNTNTGIENFNTDDVEQVDLSLDSTQKNMWFDIPSISLDDILSTLESCGADVVVGGISLIGGVFDFVECLAKGVLVLESGSFFGGLKIADFAFKSIGFEANDVEAAITEPLYDLVGSFVETEFVHSALDFFFDDTGVGNWCKEKSHDYEGVRGTCDSIGYNAMPFIISSVLEMTGVGAVAAPIVAGGASMLAGMGRGSRDALQGGADFGRAVAVGAIDALWEGAQSLIGAGAGKIFSGVTSFLPRAIGEATINSGTGGLEAMIVPLKDTIIEYENGDDFWAEYWQNFDENGGVSSIANNAIAAGVASFLGDSIGEGLGKIKNNHQNKFKQSATLNNNWQNNYGYVGTNGYNNYDGYNDFYDISDIAPNSYGVFDSPQQSLEAKIFKSTGDSEVDNYLDDALSIRSSILPESDEDVMLIKDYTSNGITGAQERVNNFEKSRSSDLIDWTNDKLRLRENFSGDSSDDALHLIMKMNDYLLAQGHSFSSDIEYGDAIEALQKGNYPEEIGQALEELNPIYRNEVMEKINEISDKNIFDAQSRSNNVHYVDIDNEDDFCQIWE